MSGYLSLCLVCEGNQIGRLEKCSTCQSYFHFPHCGLIPNSHIVDESDGEAWRDGGGLVRRVLEHIDQANCGLCAGWVKEEIEELRTAKTAEQSRAGGRSLSSLPGSSGNNTSSRIRDRSVRGQSSNKRKVDEPQKSQRINTRASQLDQRKEAARAKRDALETQIEDIRRANDIATIGMTGEPVRFPRFALQLLIKELKTREAVLSEQSRKLSIKHNFRDR